MIDNVKFVSYSIYAISCRYFDVSVEIESKIMYHNGSRRVCEQYGRGIVLICVELA